MIITSPDNQAVRLVRSLSRRKGRETAGQYLIEGERALADALDAGVDPTLILVRDGFVPAAPGIRSLLVDAAARVRVLDVALFDTVADTVHPQGVMACLPIPVGQSLDPFATLVVLLDGIRDPGNMGTLIRSAAAAGVDAVVVGPGSVDAWNPKAVRAAMGAHIRVPILDLADVDPDILRGFPIRAIAEADSSMDYDAVDWLQPSLVVIGSEATGPSDTGTRLSDLGIRIPMAAGVESLNAAVAGAVILFEIARQRRTGSGPARNGAESVTIR